MALEYVRQKAAAEKDAPRKPQKVWILDSQPGTVNTDMSDVSQVLQAVQACVATLPCPCIHFTCGTEVQHA